MHIFGSLDISEIPYSQVDLQEEFNNAGEKLLMIFATAEWCGPCRTMASSVDQWASEHPDDLIVLKVSLEFTWSSGVTN